MLKGLMRLWKIIAIATVVECAAGAALATVAGLFVGLSDWLDLLNHLAPIWFAVAILSAPAAALLLPAGRARRAVVALAVTAAVISGAEVLPDAFASLVSQGGHGNAKPLRVVTFNTWSDNTDPEAVVQRVRDARPDAAALIEMSWPMIHAGTKALASDLPYRTPGKHGCPADMILMSKRPFTAYGCQVTYAPSRPDITETIVWGRTTAPDGRPFTLATTHYAWPFPHGGQAMQRPVLARFVRAHGDADMILTGDFNLTPWSFALKGQDHDLSPLTRRTHGVPTWPAMIARLNRPAPFAILPIDQIYAGKAWRTRSVTRLRRAGSDHLGLVAEFSREP
jgi:endonuclease/exonuclease/phosphatase (EEP) superfamily protein YafD